MILSTLEEIKKELPYFKEYACVVIICKYNGGKSSLITDMIHDYLGEEHVYYATFIDQSKSHFTPRKSRLKYGEIVENKIIVFDEISDDKNRDVRAYIKKLIEKNKVIILTNPYGSSNDADKEIKLFKKEEEGIVPDHTLYIFVREI